MKLRIFHHVVALAVVFASAGAAAHFLRPTIEVASFPAMKLSELIPESFGEWHVDKSIVPIAPDPGVLKMVEQIYTDTLARTYVNAQGQRIMLSLAYGRRQNDSMRLHQPEGCYIGQGFAVTSIGFDKVEASGGTASVVRLNAIQGQRKEPITYWMVVGGRHVDTQFQGKLAQLSYGIRGYIPDGLLVRVSSFSPDYREAFKLQDSFIRALTQSVPAEYRGSFIGV